jgi:hypothetical protein
MVCFGKPTVKKNFKDKGVNLCTQGSTKKKPGSIYINIKIYNCKQKMWVAFFGTLV